MDLRSEQIEWKAIVASDPDGDGPAESELTSPFQLASQSSGVIALVNTNPWSALPEKDGNPATKPIWFPGRPVDISGLAVEAGKIRSTSQKGYVSIWRDRMGKHGIGEVDFGTEQIEEGFGGFQPIAVDGKRIVNRDASLHPRTGVGFDKDRSQMWFVVVDGRQPGYSEGMTTVELADYLLELGCSDAANLDGGGSSIMAVKKLESASLKTMNRPSDRIAGRFSLARPLPMVVVIREKKTGPEKPDNR